MIRRTERHEPWPILLLLVLIAALALCSRAEAQDVKPGPICGTEPTHPHADLVQVSCVDYDALKRLSPGVPVPDGKRTQVLIHARRGEVVAVTVGGKTKTALLTRDAWGRLVAMVAFDGVEHKDLAIKFGAWLE